ncbi:hypothetical protein DPEC_G00046150 [Dallia pectoralis]|uniref:Uncharacterized protein n=1 Tax=Dallia pectoralis TaxID=75939 RepID=A0ACC2HA98_DALPE|nr:hypothetical protein DPEC_G00046150 [Dallia pectoralis]
MDPAGQATLTRHEEMLASLGTAMDRVMTTMERLEKRLPDPATAATVPVPASPPPAARAIALQLPGHYDGAADRCQGFILQLELYFSSLNAVPSDHEKVSALVSRLTGKALAWANSIWNGGGPILHQWEAFVRTFRSIFDKPPEGREAGECLFHLRQGSRSVQDFALEFRTLAAGAGWGERAYIDAFRCSLRPDVRKELACRDATLSFDQLVDMAIKLDNLLAARGRTGPAPLALPGPAAAPVPMEVGGAAHRETARQKECTFCGRGGHSASHCYQRLGRKSDTSATQVNAPNTRLEPSDAHVTLPVRFPGFHTMSQCKALVDSGAAGIFMDRSFAHKLNIPLKLLDCPRPITALDNRPLGSGVVRQVTVPISMISNNNHTEHITFHIIESPNFPVVLGLPWLALHNPQFSWPRRVLAEWGQECQGRCLGVSINATSVESPDSVSTVRIPPEYSDLAVVFSKQLATKLPPHRPGDCAIDLQVGVVPPHSHVYPLSQAETETMETYISESLSQGIIRHSTSSASSSFFFVKKKDGGLRPCIDYRALNKITVRYRYPLPLISTVIESMHGARFFTKLDLRSAYNLVRIREGDEWKTAFSTTSGHYEYLVMPYGLMNAPSVFQSFVNNLFRDMVGRGVVVYIDDILVCSATPSSLVSRVPRHSAGSGDGDGSRGGRA